jgi:hypothetical protein
MRISLLPALLLCVAASGVSAQLMDEDPDWKEVEIPAPPAFRVDRLVALDMPRHISLKVGLDPDTLRVTPDGIIRYVMVATAASGSTYASYEGIRCVTGEVKVYARHGATGQWIPVKDPQWKPLNDNQPSPHALALARQGGCSSRAPTSHVPAEIIKKLTSREQDHR